MGLILAAAVEIETDVVHIRRNKKFLNYRKLGDVTGTNDNPRKPVAPRTNERAEKTARLMKRNESIAI